MTKKNIILDHEFKALYKTEEYLATKWIDYMKLYNIAHQIAIQKEHYKYSLKIFCYALFAIGFLFYFLILQGFYDKIILINLFDRILQPVFLNDITLFQIVTLSLVSCFIIIRFLFHKNLKSFYDYLYNHVKITSLYYTVSNFLIAYHKNILLYYIIVFVVPYIASFIIYIWESLYVGHLYYFYISLYWLLIPQITKLIIYIIQHHTKNSLDYYTTFFLLKDDQKTGTIHITYKHLEDPELIKESLDFDPQVVIQNWLFFSKILHIYNTLQMQINYYNNILYYGILIVSISIILISY